MAEQCVGPCPVQMDAEASFGTNMITETVSKINLSKQSFKYCRERVTWKEPGLPLSLLSPLALVWRGSQNHAAGCYRQ